MSEAWYYVEGDRKIGPMSLSELGNVLSRVSGAERVLVWKNGFANWTAAADIKELEPFLATPPPVPQPMVEAEINQSPQPTTPTRNYWPLLFIAILGLWLTSSFYMYAYMWLLSYAIAGIFFIVAAVLSWEERYAFALAVVGACIIGFLLNGPIVKANVEQELAVASGFASASDMREASALKITPSQLAERRAEEARRVAAAEQLRKQQEAAESACRNDWSSCPNNGDVVNKYSDWFSVRYDCREAANKQARYGTPEWSSYFFGSYLPGTDYVKTGIATLVDKDAMFQNGFGAKVHSQVICKYDLRSKSVIDVSIFAR